MRRIVILFMLALFVNISMAQSVFPYQLSETISESQSEVTFKVYVFCSDKEEIKEAACLAGIRCVMFEGIPKTKFNKPLLNEGEQTLISKNRAYFNDLYIERFNDYVKKCTMISKFKKSDIKKSTLFEVTIKVIELRKDLERNNIKTKFGI